MLEILACGFCAHKVYTSTWDMFGPPECLSCSTCHTLFHCGHSDEFFKAGYVHNFHGTYRCCPGCIYIEQKQIRRQRIDHTVGRVSEQTTATVTDNVTAPTLAVPLLLHDGSHDSKTDVMDRRCDTLELLWWCVDALAPKRVPDVSKLHKCQVHQSKEIFGRDLMMELWTYGWKMQSILALLRAQPLDAAFTDLNEVMGIYDQRKPSMTYWEEWGNFRTVWLYDLFQIARRHQNALRAKCVDPHVPVPPLSALVHEYL